MNVIPRTSTGWTRADAEASRKWKQGEVTYCHNLVKSKGNTNVPAYAVQSYLQLQMDDAVREGAIEAAQELMALRLYWTQDRP